MAVKTCTTCGETKPLDAFHKSKSGKYGRKAGCKDCVRSYNRNLYANNKEFRDEQIATWREANPDSRYWSVRKKDWRRQGIVDVDTLDWAELIEAQGSKCFVCDKVIDVYTAHRDHDHETGLTRAAVCSTKCNQAMDK